MDWTPIQTEVPGSSPWSRLNPDAQAANCKLEAREPRRALADISNAAVVNHSFGHALQSSGGLVGFDGRKRALLEPQTPARRSKAFTVFDEGVDSSCTSRAAASPPQLPAKSRALPSPQLFAENNQLLGIEELFPSAMQGDADLPDVQGLAEPSDEQERFRRAMLLDGCDGCGSPAEFASALLRSTGRDCLEAQVHQAWRWGQVDLPDDDCSLSPASTGTPGMQVWPTLLTPQTDRDHHSPVFSPLRAPSLPSVQMDVSDDEGVAGINSLPTGGAASVVNSVSRAVCFNL